MLQATPGSFVLTHGAETTYAHFDEVPVELLGRDGRGNLTTEPTAVIASGSLTSINKATGIGESVTTTDAPGYAGAVTWEVVHVEPGDEDGGTIRLVLANPVS